MLTVVNSYVFQSSSKLKHNLSQIDTSNSFYMSYRKITISYDGRFLASVWLKSKLSQYPEKFR